MRPGRNLASQGEGAVLAVRPPPRSDALHVLHLRRTRDAAVVRAPPGSAICCRVLPVPLRFVTHPCLDCVSIKNVLPTKMVKEIAASRSPQTDASAISSRDAAKRLLTGTRFQNWHGVLELDGVTMLQPGRRFSAPGHRPRSKRAPPRCQRSRLGDPRRSRRTWEVPEPPL